MTLKKAVKDAWRYLDTSHGSHEGFVNDGYGGSESVTIENKTPLEKIIAGVLILGVLAAGGLAVKSCSDEEAMKRERAIHHPFYVKMVIDSRERDIKSLKALKGADYPQIRESYEKEIREKEREIQQTAKIIREKLEKGYLKPGDDYWKDYEKIFGNETWWKEHEAQQAEKK